jgi:hypothetical protein
MNRLTSGEGLRGEQLCDDLLAGFKHSVDLLGLLAAGLGEIRTAAAPAAGKD